MMSRRSSGGSITPPASIIAEDDFYDDSDDDDFGGPAQHASMALNDRRNSKGYSRDGGMIGDRRNANDEGDCDNDHRGGSGGGKTKTSNHRHHRRSKKKTGGRRLRKSKASDRALLDNLDRTVEGAVFVVVVPATHNNATGDNDNIADSSSSSSSTTTAIDDDDDEGASDRLRKRVRMCLAALSVVFSPPPSSSPSKSSPPVLLASASSSSCSSSSSSSILSSPMPSSAPPSTPSSRNGLRSRHGSVESTAAQQQHGGATGDDDDDRSSCSNGVVDDVGDDDDSFDQDSSSSSDDDESVSSEEEEDEGDDDDDEDDMRRPPVPRAAVRMLWRHLLLRRGGCTEFSQRRRRRRRQQQSKQSPDEEGKERGGVGVGDDDGPLKDGDREEKEENEVAPSGATAAADEGPPRRERRRASDLIDEIDAALDELGDDQREDVGDDAGDGDGDNGDGDDASSLSLGDFPKLKDVGGCEGRPPVGGAISNDNGSDDEDGCSNSCDDALSKKDFNQKIQEESVRNDKTSKAMRLDTEEGRERASDIFINQVEAQKRAKEQAQNATTGASPTSESMDGIDEHDVAPVEHNTPDTPLVMKPTNFVMDCNIQKIAQALRMGLPDVAIPLLQENLQQFAAQKSQDMYFEGVNKTLPELRLEFLLQPMDLDDNTILHYAVYYESYQVVAALTHVAKEDGTLQEVLSHPNIHGQTPIWFAEIAQDESIRHLINSRVELAEKLLQQSQFGPAFKAGMARLWQAVLHISVPYILSTLLSFYLGHVIFGEHFVTCLASLVAMQYLGDDRWLGSPHSFKRVPGIRGVVILVSGLGPWEMLKLLVRFVLRHVMWELLLILAPFVLAAMSSGGRGASRGAMWLYPLRASFFYM